VAHKQRAMLLVSHVARRLNDDPGRTGGSEQLLNSCSQDDVRPCAVAAVPASLWSGEKL
jgi:hypothetical protein